MSLALAPTGRLSSVTNFLASSRISMMLLSKAKSGANGKDATNSVTNPNWMTVGQQHRGTFMNVGSIHPRTVIIMWSRFKTSRPIMETSCQSISTKRLSAYCCNNLLVSVRRPGTSRVIMMSTKTTTQQQQHQERDVSSGITEGPEEDCWTSWQVLDVFSMSWALTFAGYVEA